MRRRNSQRHQIEEEENGGRGCWRAIVDLFLAGIALTLIGITALLAGGYYYYNNELTSAVDRVATYRNELGGTPRFYDRNGELLFELPPIEQKVALEFADIPQTVISATIAVEDDTFWTNLGFDPAAIGAAVIYNVQNSDSRPIGASTITQQLVRHIAFTYEERVGTSYERKIREIMLATVLTQKRSKEEILTLYLNEIYYGNLAYGIEAAAQTYFGKPAADLDLAEASFLAGLPQAPIQWDPYTNFDGAKARQEFIVDLLLEDGAITELDAIVAKAAPLSIKPRISANETSASPVLLAPHFVLYAQQEIERRFGSEAMFAGGWQITTSIDMNIQRMAEAEARQWIDEEWGPAHDVSNAAVVVMKPSTSEVLAMVGSLDYFRDDIDGQINMALAPRQPGSTFKPLTVAAAMKHGWHAGDVLWDVPIALKIGNGETMTPVNYDGRYHGPMLLRDSLANSYNIPPIQLARDVGLPRLIGVARDMGIHSLSEQPNYYGLSLTLGGGEVPLLEMTNAFSTLANQGRYRPATSILSITNSQGEQVYSAAQNGEHSRQVIDEGIAYIITDFLDDDKARIPAMGRGSALEQPFPAAAKTGTTNDFRDNLTIGYTPSLVVGVWIGNTDGRVMQDSSGLFGAAPLWSSVLNNILSTETLAPTLALADGSPPPAEFTRPSHVIDQEVCLPQGSGGTQCTVSRTELFLAQGTGHGIARLPYVPDMSSVPGTWQLRVLPLSASAAQNINLPPLENGYAPPKPSTCVVSRPLEGSQLRLLLPVPPHYDDEVIARLWAKQNGYHSRIAPPVACPVAVTDGLKSVQVNTNTGFSNSGNTAGSSSAAAPASNNSSGGAYISSPSAGASVSGSVQIIGTANATDMSYYKLEIGTGTAPTSWTTFGSTHSQPVNGGVLETLQAASLPAGDYVIRLVIVKQDGNFSAPHQLPIKISP